MTITIRRLAVGDIETITAAFTAVGWPGKDAGLYTRYLREQEAGERLVLLAADDLAGYLTVDLHSGYPPFREAGVPEITDLNVLPQRRRRGIATALMDVAESEIARRSATAGIGVGLYADYGPAHLMYLARGYRPDGRGVVYRGEQVEPGATVRVDDDLTLMMTRRVA
jgi:GNAT superfamily N-acetyltransferase